MTSRSPDSLHLAVRIARPAQAVYDYASNPANLPAWASGLGSAVEFVDGQWIAQSPMGRVVVSFVARNEHHVLDHVVTLPSGDSVHNPMRVIADGPACEVVFTLRRQPGMSADDFARDRDAVLADLAALRTALESS